MVKWLQSLKPPILPWMQCKVPLHTSLQLPRSICLAVNLRYTGNTNQKCGSVINTLKGQNHHVGHRARLNVLLYVPTSFQMPRSFFGHGSQTHTHMHKYRCAKLRNIYMYVDDKCSPLNSTTCICTYASRIVAHSPWQECMPVHYVLSFHWVSVLSRAFKACPHQRFDPD